MFSEKRGATRRRNKKLYYLCWLVIPCRATDVRRNKVSPLLCSPNCSGLPGNVNDLINNKLLDKLRVLPFGGARGGFELFLFLISFFPSNLRRLKGLKNIPWFLTSLYFISLRVLCNRSYTGNAKSLDMG